MRARARPRAYVASCAAQRGASVVPRARTGGVVVAINTSLTKTRSLFWPRCRAWLEVVFDGRGAANSEPFHFEIDCRSATVSFNGYYEADTFTMEFDARSLPFDPDMVAYCAARVYMWDSQRNLHRPEWAVEENLMVKGLVDNISATIVGTDTVIKFECRDYTALLIDTEWDPRDAIPAGGFLPDLVQKIADAAAPKESQARFAVEFRSDNDPPIVGGTLRDTKKKGLYVKPGKNYWDVIWDLCIQHAYVPRVEGSTIIISEPNTETRQTLTQSPRLIYGRSLTSLEITRKFNRETVPQIVIVAYDPNTGKKIEVTFPSQRNVDKRVTATREQPRDALGILLTVKKEEVMYFPAPKGIIDPKALLRYARMRFYHLGRGETIYTMETNHLYVPGASGEQVNLLQLRPGRAVGVVFDPFKATHLRELEFGQRIEAVVAQGYHPKVAFFIAENVDKLDFFKQDYYYNRGDVNYSIENGVEIKIEATNFAGEVREINFAGDDPTEALRRQLIRAGLGLEEGDGQP